jgi:outer membrane murein-binding lipoprotein Lpp
MRKARLVLGAAVSVLAVFFVAGAITGQNRDEQKKQHRDLRTVLDSLTVRT